ncbi:MAG: hypothetical protein R3343_11490 [Nitriliruptorales bacterium]|nr:hypothetical protein [Nitriliruptorales bacterium]
MVPRAYLRVFEPLDAFPALERGWWESYVDSGSGLTRADAEAAESRASITRLLGGNRAATGIAPEVAFVRRVGKRIHVCPLELELRAAAALRTFRQEVPRQLVDAFLPDGDVRQTLEQLEGTRRAPHILESVWAVPFEWFALFAPRERRFRNPPEGRGPSLTYLTSAGQSHERLERVMDVIEANLEHADTLLADLVELGDWVDEFDDSSLIELDYGGISALGSVVALESDTTCADLWQAVESLEAGDELGAAAHYGVARSRWSRLRDMRSAN